MLSLFYTSILSILVTMGFSHVAKPSSAYQVLCADGTLQSRPTYDMLVSSDVGRLYGLTDWP